MKKLLSAVISAIAVACAWAQPPPPLATQAQAEAGVSNFPYMSPLRTKQAITAQGGGGGTPGGSNGQWQYNNAGAFGGFTPGTNVQTFIVTPSFSNFNAALTGDDAAGLAANNAFTGINSFAGSEVTAANAMGALAIDVMKGLNTKTVAADSTFTFSGTPATANTWFSIFITNSDSASHVVTIPSSISLAAGATVTTATIPASGYLQLTWRYDGTNYFVYGDGTNAVSDTAYASSWNGVVGIAPSKNAIYDAFGAAINYPLTVYAAGTAYVLTNSDALVDFGTTDPTKVLDKAGTYLISGRAYLKYNAATYAGTQTATVHLRRTNNTAADIPNATTTATLRIITTITDTVGIMALPPVIYTTANTDDSISVFGSVSAAPAAGSVDVTEASIIAIKLY